MKRKHVSLMTAVVAGAMICGAALGETIWVKSENVDVRSGKGAVYPVVAAVKKGTELTVVAREGKWIKVSVPGTAGAAPAEGYVYESAISVSKVDKGGGMFEGMNGGKMDTAAAAKGLQPTAEGYARGKNMDSGPLNRLIAANK